MRSFYRPVANPEQKGKKASGSHGNLEREQPPEERLPPPFEGLEQKQRQRNFNDAVNDLVEVAPKIRGSQRKGLHKALPENQPDGIEKREQTEEDKASLVRLPLQEEQSQAREASGENGHANDDGSELPSELSRYLWGASSGLGENGRCGGKYVHGRGRLRAADDQKAARSTEL
jgi:hypothetical protein